MWRASAGGGGGRVEPLVERGAGGGREPERGGVGAAVEGRRLRGDWPAEGGCELVAEGREEGAAAAASAVGVRGGVEARVVEGAVEGVAAEVWLCVWT